jgi:cytoskeletal protein RodZ
MNSSKKNYLILIIFVSLIIVAAIILSVLFLFKPKGPEETPPTTPPNDIQVESQTKRDESLLQYLAPEDKPIKGENFEIFYFDQTDAFLATIYAGDREEEIQKIYQTLRDMGVKKPENLNIVFSGPRTYKDYQP